MPELVSNRYPPCRKRLRSIRNRIYRMCAELINAGFAELPIDPATDQPDDYYYPISGYRPSNNIADGWLDIVEYLISEKRLKQSEFALVNTTTCP